jgi:hypothetical protein
MQKTRLAEGLSAMRPVRWSATATPFNPIVVGLEDSNQKALKQRATKAGSSHTLLGPDAVQADCTDCSNWSNAIDSSAKAASLGRFRRWLFADCKDPKWLPRLLRDAILVPLSDFEG